MIRSFEYEEQLHEQIEQEFSMNRAEPDPLLQPSRDPAFRRLVLKSYASTCAICRARLVTSSGISIIDVAVSAPPGARFTTVPTSFRGIKIPLSP